MKPFHNRILWLLLTSFLVWIFCFHGFIFQKLTLASDAVAYYEHFQYFTDMMSRGVYPMWEPSRQGGVPMEFFLRRIGSFNPLYSYMIVLQTVGVPFRFCYFSFLVLYFFLGMTGFYLLARRIFNHEFAALGATLLLMFSSLGTRLFDAYILFTIIPMIWFFYFVISFLKEQKRLFFLGMTLCSMILLTTYIPFYFAIIFTSFLVFLGLFYFREGRSTIRNIFLFLKKHKLLVAVCMVCVVLSVLPGLTFLNQADEGEIVLPMRHGASESKNVLEVAYETVTSWGIEEDLLYSSVYADKSKFKFAILYLPVVAYLILLMGLPLLLNKRLIFLFVWGLTLLLCFSHRGPIFEQLHKFFFFMKYFRNLHFFLWMILLPIGVLFTAEQLRILYSEKMKSKASQSMWIIYTICVHLGFAIFIFAGDRSSLGTYAAIGLSFLFFMLHFSGLKREIILFGLLFAAVVMQPLEVYHYLNKNSKPLKYDYRYDNNTRPYLNVRFTDEREKKFLVSNQARFERGELPVVQKNKARAYMSTPWFDALTRYVHPELLRDYSKSKLLLYDRVKVVNKDSVDIEQFARSLARWENIAYVISDDPESVQRSNELPARPQAEILLKNSPQLKLLKYNVNSTKFETNFARQSFLVYNDNYHGDWQAFLNGKKIPLYQANLAFKGVWVPAGENTLTFRIGSPIQYILNYGLILIFYGLFIVLIWAWRKDCKN